MKQTLQEVYELQSHVVEKACSKPVGYNEYTHVKAITGLCRLSVTIFNAVGNIMQTLYPIFTSHKNNRFDI